MVFRQFLARMGGCVEWHVDSAEESAGIDPPVQPRRRLARSTSQLAISPSPESLPPTLQRRNSDVGSRDASLLGSNSSSEYECHLSVPNISDHRSPVSNLSDHHTPNLNDRLKPVKLSSYIVDPTAAYDNNPDWTSTLHASAGLFIDIVKESSDVFTPLKSVAGGLSAILKYYDVRYPHFVKPLTPLTLQSASSGES